MDLTTISEILGYRIPYTSIAIMNILLAILIMIFGYIAAVVVSRWTHRAIIRAKMTKILAEFTSRVVRILIIIFVVAVAISNVGIDVGAAVVSISVVGGFIFGFAFQDTLGNLAAGFMIAITKPFRVDDFVEMAGIMGSVKSVGASITTMVTFDNKRVIIPNSKIWGDPIINYTALQTRMIDLKIGIGYTDDMGKAITVAMGVLQKHPKVLKDPKPNVAVAELGDSSVNLLVRPWVATSDYWTTRREVIRDIKEAFDRAGISIPFPQRDVHLIQEMK
ncbi:MAG: mechanosensitive ion channel [Candidatus Thermoplasmatota archaeon]|nr:mechanosensitive ion channel [Candidatus Thermoplasmatota archaeon]